MICVRVPTGLIVVLQYVVRNMNAISSIRFNLISKSLLRFPQRFRMSTKSPHSMPLASIDLSQYDAEQSRLMDERCIIVDETDRAIGALDKKTCEIPSLLASQLSR